MSAICGIVNFDGRPVGRSDLEIMVESSPYRGPDGVSYWIDKNAGFAYLAFHVTPESVYESQPWKDPETGVVLVADARIDNREELDAQLEGEISRLKPLLEPHLKEGRSNGGRATGVPDSLYILAAWRKWRRACVEHLLGDFVFAVWDHQAQELFLARDPLGGYGVTWHRSGETLLFASETTAILDLPSVNPQVKLINAAKILAHIPRRPEETFFENIFFLPAAHCMIASPRSLAVRRYWDIDPTLSIEYSSETDYAEHFLELVEQAVLCRIRSIHPVGIALSGGHDSSLLAAAAARQIRHSGNPEDRLRSFSYVFDRYDVADERLYIEAVVRQYGLEPTYVVADDLWTFRDLPDRDIQRDYPWTNCYVQLPLSMARTAGEAGCGVLIDGQFGDTICGGRNLVAADLLQHGRIARLFSFLYRNRGELDWREELIDKGIRPLLPTWLRRAYRRLSPRKPEPFVEGLARDWIEHLQDSHQESANSGLMKALLPSKRQRYGYLLNASWPNGFAAVRSPIYGRHGVERAYPYFDRRIVEYVIAIPSEQLSHPGHYRRLQTNAMKLVLPPLLYERRIKASYDPLLREGLLNREQQLVRRLLEDPEVVRQGLVSRTWLDEQSADSNNLAAGGYPFSMCLHLELWLRAVNEAQGGESKWAVPFHFRP